MSKLDTLLYCNNKRSLRHDTLIWLILSWLQIVSIQMRLCIWFLKKRQLSENPSRMSSLMIKLKYHLLISTSSTWAILVVSIHLTLNLLNLTLITMTHRTSKCRKLVYQKTIQNLALKTKTKILCLETRQTNK